MIEGSVQTSELLKTAKEIFPTVMKHYAREQLALSLYLSHISLYNYLLRDFFDLTKSQSINIVSQHRYKEVEV